MKIDGKQLATTILETLRAQVTTLKTKGINPHLVVILVGNDPASEAYVRQKKLKGEAIGIHVSIHHYKENVTTTLLLSAIEQCNNDNNVHGIIIQQPLPDHIDAKKLVEATDPKKDVDGFHPLSAFTPPIAEAVVVILEEISARPRLAGPQGVALRRWLRQKKVVVIGKGETGGMPIIQKLKKLGVEPTVIDSKTQRPEEPKKQADIIVSCVGRARMVKADEIKKGVILLSIGMFRGNDGKLHGDYEEDEIKDIASFYTPVLGGIGPVNVAMLLKNVIEAASMV
ncbi:MAG: bifunctional 5,10-methylenetetrahydrofolate dehydrogenase/5,10-methenyltetrahydrofolate cyclohydrolase [Candidatus Levybacteria bacterium]|nr:bifunctional 5,10-methylenetetrahydrofolate dehydrogenase/5,10-methenyltetrahydrofolate cyclohydrolase [Candidatus Levybacteria bacterium]